jgi:hypothetical protein
MKPKKSKNSQKKNLLIFETDNSYVNLKLTKMIKHIKHAIKGFDETDQKNAMDELKHKLFRISKSIYQEIKIKNDQEEKETIEFEFLQTNSFNSSNYTKEIHEKIEQFLTIKEHMEFFSKKIQLSDINLQRHSIYNKSNEFLLKNIKKYHPDSFNNMEIEDILNTKIKNTNLMNFDFLYQNNTYNIMNWNTKPIKLFPKLIPDIDLVYFIIDLSSFEKFENKSNNFLNANNFEMFFTNSKKNLKIIIIFINSEYLDEKLKNDEYVKNFKSFHSNIKEAKKLIKSENIKTDDVIQFLTDFFKTKYSQLNDDQKEIYFQRVCLLNTGHIKNILDLTEKLLN